MTRGPWRVLFAVAAGPRVGFGHFCRSRSLARALDVPHVVAVCGTAATRRAIRATGATTWPATPAAIGRFNPHLIVIDDPSRARAAAWVRHARRRSVPVASVHDLGLAHVASDIVIDASPVGRRAKPRAHLSGPIFTVLDPLHSAPGIRRTSRLPGRVLIALGGGAHVRRFGAAFARAIALAIDGVEIVVAPGFSEAKRPALPAGARWLRTPDSLPDELCRCSAAVIGGGITLAEACALSTPVIGVAVTRAQRHTVRAFASAGAVIDGGTAPARTTPDRVAAGVRRLFLGGPAVEDMTWRAGRLVDGCGALRVADALVGLMGSKRRAGEQSHAA